VPFWVFDIEFGPNPICSNAIISNILVFVLGTLIGKIDYDLSHFTPH
jgi:hypothetical protein